MGYRGIEYLRRKLEEKRFRVLLRYQYYDMKNAMKDFRINSNERYQLKEVLGWCSKAVDSLADRLSFREFREDNFDLEGIFDMNSRDIFFDSAINAALIASCSFVYISKSPEGFPRLQVIDAANATGEIDPITNMLTEGYAVLRRSPGGTPSLEAYFIPGATIYYDFEKRKKWTVRNPAPYPLLVPIIYRPDAVRRFGHSRITRACMNLTQGALRTLKRAEISAEYYSFPQKYVLGLDSDVEFDNRKAAASDFLNFGRGDSGEMPKVGQFTQQSMSPFTEQLRSYAALFAGETGLTLDDLGFVTDNPSSSEAIKASHENLRLAARKAQKNFGTGFLNVGYLAACVRDQFPYKREQLYLTKPIWDPVFEPDAATLSCIGDGAIKINQAVPGYFTAENLQDLTGIESSQ